MILVFTSCVSRIKVRVDALNMPLYKQTAFYNSEKNILLINSLNAIISTQITQKINTSTIQPIVDFIESSGAFSDKDKESEKKRTIALYMEASDAYITAATKLKNKLVENNSIDVNSLVEYSTFKIASNSLLDTINGLLQLIINNKEKISTNQLEAYLNNSIETNKYLNSVFGASIISDPNASVIASLPKQYWSKFNKEADLTSNKTAFTKANTIETKPSRYNLSKAFTLFGNADIAITMRSPGEFIVKGVRVDADEAVKTSFKVLNQGIKYLAASYGVAIKTDNNQNTFKNIIPELDSIEIKKTALNNQIINVQTSTDALLSVINQVLIDKDFNNAEKKKMALKRISKAVEQLNN
jgi:hypothetical protein